MKVELLSDGEIRWRRGIFKVPRKSQCWLCQFARFLLRSGVNPEEVLEVHRGGTRVFTDASASWWAGKTTVENDVFSIRMKAFVPFNGDDE